MKKPTKSIITSSLLAVAFGALSVGTTFALFTSQSETQINVESAIVDVGSTLSNPTLYSASATYTTGDVAGTLTGTFAGTYYYEPQPGLTFANGGSVTLQNSILGIQKMTPGDKVSGSLSFVNNSNVNIKYRFVVNTSSESDDILLSNMVFKVLGNTYTGLKNLRTNWMPLAAFGSIDSTTLEVILPLEAGNENQNKSASYAFSVEAVQGNAITSEEEYVSYVTSTYVPLNVNDVDNQSKLVNQKVVEAALPNAQTASEIVSVTVPQNAKLDSNASALTLYVENLGEDEDYQGIVIDVDQGAENYDVTLEGLDENNQEEVTVSINLGYEPVRVYHTHGNTTTQVDFEYVGSTGITTFTVTNFSEFTFVRETDIIEVPNVAKLKLVRDYVNEGNSLAGKTVKLMDNLDMSSEANWTPIGSYDHPFSGIFDGNGKTISNYTINVSAGNAGLLGYVKGSEKNVDYKGKWNADSGTFDYSDLGSEYTASVKNLTVENATVTNSSSQKATGAVIGAAAFATISNIAVKNSSVVAEKGVGGVLGNIDGSFVENCSADADTIVLARVYNVGGIIGCTANAQQSPQFDIPSMIYNCSNYATVTINGTTGYAGGVLGNGQNAFNNVIADCHNFGKVVAANTNALTSPVSENSGIAGITGSANGVYLLLNCVNEASASFEVVTNGEGVVQDFFNSVAGISFYGSGRNYFNCSNKADIAVAANKVAGITVAENAHVTGCTNEGNLVNTLIPSAVYEISSDMKVINIQNRDFDSVSELNAQIAEQFGSAPNVINVNLKNVTINGVAGTGTLVVPNGIQTIVANSKVCDNVQLVDSLVRINMTGLEQSVSGNRTLVFGGSNNTIRVLENNSMGSIVLNGNANHVVNDGALDSVSVIGDGTGFTVVNNGTLGHLSAVATTASLTLTNNGTLLNASGNGIHVEAACTLVINNHGSISGSYFSILLYDGCTVTINAYAESTVTGAFAPFRGNNDIHVYYQDGATINGQSWTSVASTTYNVVVAPMA